MMEIQHQILAIAESSFIRFVNMEAALDLKLMEACSTDVEEEGSRLLSIHDNVALIEIKGMLVNRDSWLNRYFGAISYNEIRQACIEAMEAGASAVVFNIDSPGGNVAGLADTANLISNMGVKTLSFTSSAMCSAAYFLGCQTDKVYADTFAEVGSVGVVVKMYDRSKHLADMGIKPLRFRSGKLKAVGDPDFKMSKEELNYVQDKVLKYASKFYDIVSDARGMPLPVMEKAGITSGKTFIGEEAKDVNLVDGIHTFDEVMLKAFTLAKEVDKDVTNSLFLP
jgi:signal peptide peptidase SppA